MLLHFYKMAYLGRPKEAVDKYVGEDYIQHNPAVKSGKQGFIDYFERMQKEYPNKDIEFLRAVAQGNFCGSSHTSKHGLGTKNM